LNAKLIKKTATNILIASILALFLMPTSFAKKGGGGKPPPEPEPVETSCADAESDSDFPAFAYTVQKSGRKGVSGYDFYLSNADGDCSIKIHTSDYKGNDLEFSYSQYGIDGVIVWRQDNNEYGGRKDADLNADRIKLIRFKTSNKVVTTPLPLASSVVAVVNPGSGETGRNSFRYIDLSGDASTILVSHGDNINYPGFTHNSIREIDISNNCSSNCSMSAPLISTTEHITIGLSYNADQSRIYYTGKYRNNSSDPLLVGQYYVAFIENQGASWSAPRFITLSGNGLHGDPNYFRQPDVAIADLDNGNGYTEVLAFHYTQRNDSSAAAVQIIDVGSCTAVGSEDCLVSGKSSVFSDIFDGHNVSFNDKSSATSILFATSTGIIMERDLLSGIEKVLVDGWQADSGN